MVQCDVQPTIGYYGSEIKVRSGVVGEFIVELRDVAELKSATQKKSVSVQFYNFSCIPEEIYKRRSGGELVRLGQRKDIYAKVGGYTIWMDFHVGIEFEVSRTLYPTTIGLANSDVLNQPQSVRIYDGKWSQVAAFYINRWDMLKHVNKDQVYTTQKGDGWGELSEKDLPMLIKEAIRGIF